MTRSLTLLLSSVALFCSLGLAQSEAVTVRHRVLAADASKRRIAIFDADGKIEWEHKTRSLHDLQQLDNGNILFQTTWTKLVEVTRKNQVVWSYDSAKRNGNEGKRIEVHAFQRLADGSTMIAESGASRIIEVDRDGKILRQIKLQVRRSSPHRDTRLVRKLKNGNYLVAHEGEGAVREYDQTGKVVWDYPVPLFDKKRRGGHGLEAWGNQVFCAIRLANGNTLISTGNGHAVLEVTPQKKIVWHLKQNDLPGIRLAWVTTLEVLPNGNYVIGNCHAGPNNPQILEINKAKQVLWKFHDFVNLGNALSNSTLVDSPVRAAANAVFTLPSDKGKLAAAFQFSDPKAFRITDDSELELFQASKYRPKVRSPHCIALIDGVEFGDFTLEAELQQRSTHSSKHRDLCLFFGVQDASHFYYVHMAIAADPHAHNIFRVNAKPRIAIATRTTKGIEWGRNKWHKIKLERRLADGSIKVYFDDMETPIMEATDKSFGRGLVGLGSFDDVGRYRNIKIHSPDRKATTRKIFK